jgi:hypothetical protein
MWLVSTSNGVYDHLAEEPKIKGLFFIFYQSKLDR